MSLIIAAIAPATTPSASCLRPPSIAGWTSAYLPGVQRRPEPGVRLQRSVGRFFEKSRAG